MVFALLLIPVIRLHPNENTYFNILAGGLRGAAKKNLVDWSITFGNIYRQGVVWLNKHAEKDARIAHLDGSMFAISTLWLREDMSISPNYFSEFNQKGEYIMTLFNPLYPRVFAARYPFRFLKPIHTIDVDGASLLFIFKNVPKYSLINAKAEKHLVSLNVAPIHDGQNDYLKIDLGKEINVTKIIVNASEKCLEEKNEFIGFFDQKNLEESTDLFKFFTLNERKNLGKNRIEYDFPAELARYILVYPQNSSSCFVKGRITSVSYIEDL